MTSKGSNHPEQTLRGWLKEEERRISKSLNIERRLDLFELVRAMDYFSVGTWLELIPQSDKSEQIAQRLNYGMNKALTLTLDESSKFDGAPLFCSNNHSIEWADSFLQYIGNLGYCEHLLELCRLRLLKLRRHNSQSYKISSIAQNAGMEYLERTDFEWHVDFLTRSQQPQLKNLQARQTHVWNMMYKLVAPWMTHYIQYDTHPDIDSFYNEVGILNAQTMIGQDSLPKNVDIGNIPFGLYCDVVAVLVGWSIKHLGFCFQLLRKSPSTNPRNIFTITMPFERVVRNLQVALHLPHDTAQHVLRTLTLTTEKLHTHCFPPGDLVAPPFIQIGDQKLLRPIWGNLTNPFAFLLRELQSAHRKDWDRAVNLRETVFREDLYQLFSSERFIKISRNIKLKKNGKLLTDIDALIFDPTNNTVGLFQLKWQDLFRNNMRERESRKTNLLHTGNKWIENVTLWLNETEPEVIIGTLGLDNFRAEDLKLFRLFVLGRNFSHFSGDETPNQKAAWGLWYQVIRLMSEKVDLTNPIDSLFNELLADSPLNKELPPLSKEVINLNGVTITVDA